ncbi:isochorismatase family protein [Pseudomonas japonica]|uniref:Bifunctional isochorismate lyase / aryl carrier protein n=1 Tax=Pseudomonas japonica TaxID=256466 RepID=A0A239KXG7_9PSED|nr:isochorismatase family protein [Pseudomonas japonica]SNT21954.1 bifunctional isochorismate lyase / aryl carrier protein [Pseudomonas japonica]
MSIALLSDYPLPTPNLYREAKVAWPLQTRRSALLIHDMQDYFVNFYERKDGLISDVIGNIVRLKAWCRAHGIPVYYSAQPAQQNPQDRGLLTDMWGSGLTARPELAGIVQALAPQAQDRMLVKWRYSAFFRSDLARQLADEGRDQLIICGVYAHIGVLQTAADAFMQGIQPFVVGDAVADFSQADHLNALQYVQRNLGVVKTLADVVEPVPAAAAVCA